MIIIINFTKWFYSRLGYGVTIWKDTNIKYIPCTKLEIHSNTNVGI